MGSRWNREPLYEQSAYFPTPHPSYKKHIQGQFNVSGRFRDSMYIASPPRPQQFSTFSRDIQGFLSGTSVFVEWIEMRKKECIIYQHLWISFDPRLVCFVCHNRPTGADYTFMVHAEIPSPKHGYSSLIQIIERRVKKQSKYLFAFIFCGMSAGTCHSRFSMTPMVVLIRIYTISQFEKKRSQLLSDCNLHYFE